MDTTASSKSVSPPHLQEVFREKGSSLFRSKAIILVLERATRGHQTSADSETGP